ncbi:MAG: hypothetical protein ACRDSK_24880 [Actinophytocola sp.]|uniref:hypothetical protein n=1 Tax=Actinophytocola sp. TaxID=1872138 RepID=UPI003D6C24A7
MISTKSAPRARKSAFSGNIAPSAVSSASSLREMPWWRRRTIGSVRLIGATVRWAATI